MRTQKGSFHQNSNLTERSHLRTDCARDERSLIHTCGQVFDDGGCIELIRQPATGHLSLLLSDKEKFRVGSEVNFRGRIYRPAAIKEGFLRAVKLPTKCGHYETTGKLFKEIKELFNLYDFPEEVALLTAYFVFPTWFPEFVPIAPCLSIVGPRPEAVLLLQLLGCLVRHPLRLGEITRASLCSLPMGLQLSLLIDQERISRSVRGLLSASNYRSVYISRKDDLLNIFCSKAVYCGDTVSGDHFGDETLRIHLAPSHGRIPILSEKDENEIADQFQAKMLAYRCRNISKVRESTFDVPDFTSGIRTLAGVLGVPIIDAPELQSGLCPLLRAYEEEARASRWLDLRCVVIEAVLHHCQRETGKKVHVGKITETVNAILKGRGEVSEWKPQEIGPILKTLGLSEKRDKKGYAIRLDDKVCRHMREFAYRFDVATAQEGVAGCTHDAETFAAGNTRSQHRAKSTVGEGRPMKSSRVQK